MKDIVIHHDLVRNTKLAIPSNFLKYKYVLIMTKTTSARYDIILDLISHTDCITVKRDKKTWHIAGFTNNIKDIKNFSTLYELTKGIKNVFFFRNGVLTKFNTNFNRMVDCAVMSSESLSKEAYCGEQETKTKEEFDTNGIVGIRISLDMLKNTTKFKKVDVAIQTFPCQHVNNRFFNPFNYRDTNFTMKEAYHAFILRNDKSVFDCPYFNIDRYSCKFDEEIRQV